MEKENPCSFFFVFHLKQLSFFPYECPVYVDIDGFTVFTPRTPQTPSGAQ